MENWRDIPGFEGRYQVSDLGRVRSLDRIEEIPGRWGGLMQRRHKGRILSQHAGNTGYLVVYLYAEDISQRRWLTHRLVALCFCDGIKDEVNHKDFDKINNRATNLEWVTRKGNVAHAAAAGKMYRPGHAVIGTPLGGGTPIYFDSQIEAEIFIRGKQTAAVHQCLIGRCKSAYGYVWRRV